MRTEPEGTAEQGRALNEHGAKADRVEPDDQRESPEKKVPEWLARELFKIFV